MITLTLKSYSIKSRYWSLGKKSLKVYCEGTSKYSEKTTYI